MGTKVRKIKAIWTWFMDGLTEAVIACVDFVSARRVIQIVLDSKPPSLRDPSGKEVGRILDREHPLLIEPVEIRQKLAGALIDIVVPHSFVLHRNLNPIAAESAPFLDAFARHHIERVTPWKAADTFFGISTTRLPGKPPRLAVSVHVIARRLLADILAGLNDLNPSRLRLLLPSTDLADAIIVPVNEQKTRQIRVRQTARIVVLASFLLIALRLAYFPWQIMSLQSETTEAETQIAEQKAALAALNSGGSGGFTAKDLVAMRERRPRAVETLEAMSAALPDDAYLVSFQLVADELHISGISRQTSDLVPALEGSKHFLDVSFAEATTRLQDGSANRYHPSMHVAPPTKAASP
jgi:general secretion pathway protein L